MSKYDSDKSFDIVGEACSTFWQEYFTPAEWLLEREKIVLKKSERPVTDQPMYVMSPEIHRYTKWKFFPHNTDSCDGYLNKIKQCIKYHIENCPLAAMKNTSIFNLHIDWDNLYRLAHSLWPRYGPFNRSESFEPIPIYPILKQEFCSQRNMHYSLGVQEEHMGIVTTKTLLCVLKQMHIVDYGRYTMWHL